MKKEQEGTITVFLSLTFLLVLAVVMTTIESARVNAAKAGCERSLITAMDSVLAEYYTPLYEEYHIFGLDSGYGTDAMDTKIISEKAEAYMEYTFDPGKEISLPGDIPLNYLNLYGVKTDEVKVNNFKTLMDYQGDFFVNQATAYMKYNATTNGVESFLGNVTDMQEADNAQSVLEEKQETEESLYEIDEDILELMRLIDGIKINEDGVKLDKNDKIIILDNFVKKICFYPVTKDNLGLYNDLVFNSLKDHYNNPIDTINEGENIISDLYENAENKEKAKEEYEDLLSVDQSQIKDPDKRKEHKKALSKAKKSYEKYKKEEDTLITSLKDTLDSIENLTNGTLSVTRDALGTIDGLMEKQEEATKKIIDYENTLKENQENLNEDFYKGLLEDLTSMEKYKTADNDSDSGAANVSENSTGSSGAGSADNIDNGGEDSILHYDFAGMKETLLHDEIILKAVKSESDLSVSKEETSWDKCKSALDSMKNSFESYSHDKLYFDYSSITKPVESESFFKGLQSLMEDGIMSLVIEDMNALSKKEISGDSLPSKIHEVEESSGSEDVSDIFSSIGLGSKNTLSDVFGSFKDNFDFTETALQGGNVIGEFLLFQEYLTSNFASFNKENEENTLKSLEYELEYILMGKSNDYDNLKAVITKILLIRTVMNLITLISDTKSSEEARILAAGFVGFTGLPALIEITKLIILTIWAFTESLVDITALLQGKTVPLMKSGSNMQVDLYDIFTLSKYMIQSKADKMQNKSTALALGYKDYAKLFLYMENKEKKNYRAMDLIQENIRLKYEDTFYIKNCIVSFQAEGTFSMDAKFVSLPFVAYLLNDDADAGYEFKTTKEYAY